jgi:Uncharacterized conserved protein
MIEKEKENTDMNGKQSLPQAFILLMLVVAGNLLYAMTVKLFLLPAGLVTGGTTGIALAIHQALGIPVSLFVLIFNVLMLVIGYFLVGRTFAITTIISTFTYPAALELWDQLLGDWVVTQDILLCTLFSGLGIGLSLGIVIRAGASTGGMDIPPLVLNRYFRIPVSLSLYVFDFCILLTQAFWSTPEKLLYGIVLVMTYTIVLDKLMLMGTARTEVKVVTRYPQQVRDAILQKLDRGVTLFYGEGGYLHQETQVVFSIISNRELPQAEKLIRSIDPESFMVVSRVSEVRGRGFSMSKKYQ